MDLGVADAFDPRQNVDAGGAYLRRLTDEFGTVLAIAAYNAGPGAVRRYNGIPPYAETRAYDGPFSTAAGQLSRNMTRPRTGRSPWPRRTLLKTPPRPTAGRRMTIDELDVVADDALAQALALCGAQVLALGIDPTPSRGGEPSCSPPPSPQQGFRSR